MREKTFVTWPLNIGCCCSTIRWPHSRVVNWGQSFDTLQSPNISSWGGHVLRGDDGVYHLWVSEFVNGCGLSAWLSNSHVVHATVRGTEALYAVPTLTLEFG